MGLVQHPGSDLALVQHPPERAVAELLGRDDENGGVAEPDPVERVGTFREGQQPVDRDAGADAARLEPRHLIRHERDQGRDHHREGARLVVAGERRNLVAEGLSGARGQNPQYVLPGHRRLDDGLLHGAPVITRRLRTEAGIPEPAGELLAGIVPLAAPSAGGVPAAGIPQAPNQPARLRKLVAHPGRHDRVTTGDREPGKGVGQRPAGAGGVRRVFAGMGETGVAFEPGFDRVVGFFVRGTAGTTQSRKEAVETRPLGRGRSQPVPGGQKLRRNIPKRPALVAEQSQREAGIELRDRSAARA